MAVRTAPIAPTPRVISIIGSKGGTLKTSLAATIAHVLADRGYGVRLLDVDPQASLTLRCGFERVPTPLTEPPVKLRYSYMNPDGVREEAAVAGPVSLVRGGRTLEGATGYEIAAQIRRTLASDPAPDFVVIDTPPALGTHTQEAMKAAGCIVMPTDLTREGAQGAMDVLELYEAMDLSAPIRIVGTRTDYRIAEINDVHRHVFDDDAPFTRVRGVRAAAEIPFAKAGAESSSFALPVTVTVPRDRVSIAYRKLVTEIGRAMGLTLRQRRLHRAEVV